MKNENLVKLEEYKGIDLMYDKQSGLVLFNFENRERDVKYVFEARRIIDTPVWEDCDLKGLFVDGVFSDFIGLAIAKRKNIKDGRPEWKYKGEYDLDYKLGNYADTRKVFPLNKANTDVYNKFKAQRAVVQQAENELKRIIKTLED